MNSDLAQIILKIIISKKKNYFILFFKLITHAIISSILIVGDEKDMLTNNLISISSSSSRKQRNRSLDPNLLDSSSPRVLMSPIKSTNSLLKSDEKNSPKSDLATRRLTPTLKITVPSNEELISSPESISSISCRNLDNASVGDRSASEDIDSPKTPLTRNSKIFNYKEGKKGKLQDKCEIKMMPGHKRLQRSDSKWNKVKRAFLPSSSTSSVPQTPIRTSYLDGKNLKL